MKAASTEEKFALAQLALNQIFNLVTDVTAPQKIRDAQYLIGAAIRLSKLGYRIVSIERTE